MWTIVLMGLGGLLAGGGIAFKRQEAPLPVTISFWVLAVMAIVAGWLLTL